MKLNPEQLKQILQQRPIFWTEEETKALLPLIGLTAKEYYYHADEAGSNSTRRFEVHHKRLFLFSVHINTSRSISINNPYINWGESLSGIAFGGMDTVKDVIAIIVHMANRIDQQYTGQVIYHEDCEYTEEEFQSAIMHLNDIIFTNA